MKSKLCLISLLVNIMFCVNYTNAGEFQPSFESLEQAGPVPEWFKDAKFGIYFHWGVYTVPAFGNEWYPRNMYFDGSPENRHHTAVFGDVSQWPFDHFIAGDRDKQGNFVQFAPKLKSEGGKFDPEEWAQLFADAGARFAGPVAEHHDGFSMWASNVNPWNANDMGPQLDLVGLLTDAIRARDLKVILSMHHAYNITGFYEAVPHTNDPVLQMLYGQQGKEKNEAFWLAKHKEIIDNYQPDIIWQDFNLHVISQPVLLGFLSYYYNQAAKWGKPVVATFKDGLNTRCAVLDYERGGPADITENYWLTDDAISSSSWCYTEGIGYYSKTQILHGFLDRISKNGNLLLNISPKADGSIPQEQKELLLAMGTWLKKYGEAVYATRAWDKYGEGPTKMGAAHGVFMEPAKGTAGDVRYTRSKDNTILYAILLDWEKGQKEVVLHSLSSDRIDLQGLVSVALVNGQAGNYLPLDYKQEAEGLTINLPARWFEEMAYVLVLKFKEQIPPLDKYAEMDSAVHYHLVPTNNNGSLVLGADMSLTKQKKDAANQWKLEHTGKGVYKILDRDNLELGLDYNNKENTIQVAAFSGKDHQLWKIDDVHGGSYTITNVKFPNIILAVSIPVENGSPAVILDTKTDQTFKWQLMPVCETPQLAFKPLTIPGTIQVEDYDTGCPGDAWYDKGIENSGGEYRLDEGADIEVCDAGGYNIGWTSTGEWLAYSVTILESANYEVSFFIATTVDQNKLHLECDGMDVSGPVIIPVTGGYQNWQVVNHTIKLDAGQHVLKLIWDSDGTNVDKMVFAKIP